MQVWKSRCCCWKDFKINNSYKSSPLLQVLTSKKVPHSGLTLCKLSDIKINKTQTNKINFDQVQTSLVSLALKLQNKKGLRDGSWQDVIFNIQYVTCHHCHHLSALGPKLHCLRVLIGYSFSVWVGSFMILTITHQWMSAQSSWGRKNFYPLKFDYSAWNETKESENRSLRSILAVNQEKPRKFLS